MGHCNDAPTCMHIVITWPCGTRSELRQFYPDDVATTLEVLQHAFRHVTESFLETYYPVQEDCAQ